MDEGYEIYEYARRGSLADLRESLAAGVKPDAYQAYDGSTALVMAARSGHGQIVQALLDAKASIDARTDEGSTALSHAVSGGSPDAVRSLLKAGVPVDEANEDGVTPLILAAHYGVAAVVRTLCDAGASVNLEAEGWGTALDSCESEEIVRLLEGYGAQRSTGGLNQPLARGGERFTYGCFESGANLGSSTTPAQAAPTTAPSQVAAASTATKGDFVKLRVAKSGLLKADDVGEVIEDDGSDSVPLKVKFGESYDYYDYHDVVVCAAPVELPPDSDRATSEGTLRYTTSKLHASCPPSSLGSTGLSVSPLGFGCHRLCDEATHKEALALAIKLGCNIIDLAPNYSDGAAEVAAGAVLQELLEAKKVRRDELVIISKVGNVLGKQTQFKEGVKNMTQLNDNLWHCISPEWIEQEITRSLERLRLQCLDCVLLHCPEVEGKGEGVDEDEVYRRLKEAFAHLESEVKKGRIAMYGVSAAFYPLRPTDAEHLVLPRVMEQLPEAHHFRVLQFPLNFAEAQVRKVGHVARQADGCARKAGAAAEAMSLFELTKEHGLGVLTNRPLDGIYKESHGVLRFSSLDCDVRSFSELQLDNCDSMEEKLGGICGFSSPPYNLTDGATGALAGKTVKVLSSLEGVDSVLLGMRQVAHVVSAVPLTFGTKRLSPQVAEKALEAMHNTIQMWFATAIHEADHGTSKDWRLPVNEKFQATEGPAAQAMGA
eukprot:TRINITY_DN30653_c0_g1_i1.p1 TRINITY_DN30653_c0_g1~~TRINITY_DN30653_c0_g1_i1.p1  ORF type:complete len:715 (+),score=223.24 TRINITY_DN30653_c0_g1_i1:93-2237(+)